MAEAFIFSTHISGGVRNRTGIATTRASASLPHYAPPPFARLYGPSMLLIIYNLSSSNFKIANQFSLVLK
jgi:hypothetical protein